MITSAHNPRVKAATKLRESRERRKQDRIIIDGVRELRRAWEAGVEFTEVFVCDELCRDAETVRLVNDLRGAAVQTGIVGGNRRGPAEVIEVSASIFEKIAFGERAEGVVAIARTPAATLAELKLPANPLVAVLEGIEKPGNVGAALRSADAAGVSALIVADGGTDLYNPNAIRASLGTIFTVPVCAAPTLEVLAWLQAKELVIYAAWVDAPIQYTDANFTQPCAIALGSEADGLSEQWRPDAASPRDLITAIQIPMHGAADSLNVSTAAAVLFFEAQRQRMASRS